MERRAVLKIVALTALSQKLNALPGAAMSHMQAAPGAPTATAYTGAHEARTNLFADLMVANSSDAVKKQWQDGIRLIREQALVSSLTEALRRAAANEEDPKTDLELFFVLLKQMTVNGYYTSATGVHKEMEYIGNTYLVAFPTCSHPEHQD
jgi:hypothetical protein